MLEILLKIHQDAAKEAGMASPPPTPGAPVKGQTSLPAAGAGMPTMPGVNPEQDMAMQQQQQQMLDQQNTQAQQLQQAEFKGQQQQLSAQEEAQKLKLDNERLKAEVQLAKKKPPVVAKPSPHAWQTRLDRLAKRTAQVSKLASGQSPQSPVTANPVPSTPQVPAAELDRRRAMASENLSSKPTFKPIENFTGQLSDISSDISDQLNEHDPRASQNYYDEAYATPAGQEGKATLGNIGRGLGWGISKPFAWGADTVRNVGNFGAKSINNMYGGVADAAHYLSKEVNDKGILDADIGGVWDNGYKRYLGGLGGTAGTAVGLATGGLGLAGLGGAGAYDATWGESPGQQDDGPGYEGDPLADSEQLAKLYGEAQPYYEMPPEMQGRGKYMANAMQTAGLTHPGMFGEYPDLGRFKTPWMNDVAHKYLPMADQMFLGGALTAPYRPDPSQFTSSSGQYTPTNPYPYSGQAGGMPTVAPQMGSGMLGGLFQNNVPQWMNPNRGQ
jgi:hypothetical protein